MAKVERLAEDIEELGMPTVHVSNQGIDIWLKPKDSYISDSKFCFTDGAEIIASIDPAEVELKKAESKYHKRYYSVRRIRDEQIIAAILWPK